MTAGRFYEALVLGAISVVVLVLCILLVFSGIRFTILWCRQHPLRKPPCQHDLIVCDYRRAYDDDYRVNEQYRAACKKCGVTNWVEASYLNGMADLGLYKRREKE
ncbi:hypothetical protein LEO2_3 [Bacillus phage Leo2]|uniref:Uncharacterized protein n=1 Tax=Bacillus phage Leo2 TaxID=1815973 RepID=A0A1S5QTT6_9CAUD|nr:hypothetical protein LEO2_3 [Bacillus phage Leo2]